ncbi:MAG TPA: M14 family zinc carboxypeptidase [bacterium]|nr:M14 family zinc carboxypeptidase [bacterium]HQO91205.1 M14 family zinc carboxypeptidase [bacterium]
MRKFIAVTFTMLFLINVYGELYEVKIQSSNLWAKQTIAQFDILSASPGKNSDIIYILDSTPEEIMLLNGNTEIKELSGPITIQTSYSDLEGINKRIDHAVERSGGNAMVFDIGQSVEGRKIRAVRISKSGLTNEDLPEVLFVGLHHAREWITSEVTMGILEFLVEYMDSNSFVSDILQNSVIWFVPMLNPDGYLFSWEEARMWRYNRRVHPDESIGVDLNRNYDSSWIKIDYVHGEGPFSEPETQAVKNLILNDFEEPLADGIKSLDGLITYHSYGQIIMYPPGSTEEPAARHEYYKDLAEKMAYLAFSECGSVYIVMQNSSLYFTFGEMTEWFMNTHDGKPSFTFELRPHMGSDYFFMLPEDQIIDTVKENITPALYFVRHIVSGDADLVMDIDRNGVNDVLENTSFDYKCDRSDLEIPDAVNDSESNDHSLDIPDSDNSDMTDTNGTYNEQNDTVPAEDNGCNLTLIQGH